MPLISQLHTESFGLGYPCWERRAPGDDVQHRRRVHDEEPGALELTQIRVGVDHNLSKS